ncbi:hypothetical protein BSKO_00678 [Bryopsis sp. KO-2023]|nr:hypothetical protein BSKO_00678 [Bryopsis sp. KO-2023]
MEAVRSLFLEDRYGQLFSEEAKDSSSRQFSGLVSKWCQKEKIKTSAVALVVCLNIGVDPPGVLKISPCARKQCWIDPTALPNQRALEAIGKKLQSQYERWQHRAKYKLAMDPTIEIVRKQCAALRKTAKTERVLFHYNGHGVPRPTDNGEIWVFNSQYTQYIPLSIYDLHSWILHPVIYVFDCPSAGTVVNSFKGMMEQGRSNEEGYAPFGHEENPLKDVIVLAACRANEMLPQDPEFPADLFTSCLTTPLKVALRWLLPRSLVSDKRITPELVDNIPGFPSDRKTPLGELNWIFTAITDTIAWNVLPRELFQKLFRQDLLVASLFRNFLLAERVMSSVGVLPISHPRLPPTANHSMWQAWDLAAEQVLMQLPGLLLLDPPKAFEPTMFFADQLDSFELWLQQGSAHKPPPRQLPIVLQVLLSPVHRLRALDLLYRFLELGTWGVDLALSVGIFPYVLKLLQTTTPELQETLIRIWAKIMSLDTACQHDLVKDNGHLYFVRLLESGAVNMELNAKAAFVLAVMCDNYPKGQLECLKSNMMRMCDGLLRAAVPPGQVGAVWELWKSVCLCIGKMCDGRPEGILKALEQRTDELVASVAAIAEDPEVRAAAIYALSTMILVEPPPHELLTQGYMQVIQRALDAALRVAYDGSPLVRIEIGCMLARLAMKADVGAYLQEAGKVVQDLASQQIRSLQRDASGLDAIMSRHDGPPPVQNPDVLRWATVDAAQVNYSHHSDSGVTRGHDDPGISHRGGFEPGWPGQRGFDSVPPPPMSQAPIGEIHKRIVEMMCLLATDPYPEVAEVGRQALKLIHWEVLLLGSHRSRHKHSFSAPHLPSLFSASGPVRQRWFRSKSKGSEKSYTTQSSAGSEHEALHSDLLSIRLELGSKHCQRTPFTLRRSEEHAPVVAGGSLNQLLRGPHRGGQHVPDQGRVAPTVPSSRVFKLWRQKVALPAKERHRLVDEFYRLDVSSERADVHQGEARLGRKPISMELKFDAVGSLLFDPAMPLLAATSREGSMKIVDYEKKTCVSFFHVAGSKSSHHTVAVDPVSLFSLNNRGLDFVLVCGTDGSVRVLDGCVTASEPRLVSAWQSVPVQMAPRHQREPAAFEWQPLSGELFSSGGDAKGSICRMNVEYECQLPQFAVDQNSMPNVDFLRCFAHNPCLLVAGTSDGVVKLFDLRSSAPAPVASSKPFASSNHQAIAGLSLASDDQTERVSVISQDGKMLLLDLRAVGRGAVEFGVVKSIQAHSRGGVSALASHASMKLMASATLQPVVKVWSANAEQVGAATPYRPGSESLQGPVACLSFHQKEAKFAAAGKGGVCVIYDVRTNGTVPENACSSHNSTSGSTSR